MSRELRDRTTAEDWLGAGLCLMRLCAPSPTSLEAVAPWIVAAHSELHTLPPPGFVADLGHALSGAALELAGPRSTADAELRGALRLYEDQVLGRLGADPRLDAACDAVARLPADLRPEAVVVLLGNVLSRLEYDAGVSFNLGISRSLTDRAASEVLERGFARLHQPGEILEALAEGYRQLARGARHAGNLLTDADVFTLENLAVLRTSNQRLALQQVAEAAEELERALPRRARRSLRAGRRTATQIEDEDKYPIGGFSSMSTSGSIENLVTSELIYMDDETAPGEVDLFDLRYVEGELLYYTRDESVFLRNRHVVTFALMPELTRARFKDRGAKSQRLVLAMGMVLCLVRRLSEWLNEEGLLFRVVFVGGEAVLAPERELAALMLREWIEKGTAEIAVVPDLPAVLADALARSRTAESDVVVMGNGAAKADVHPRVQVLQADFSHANPVLTGRGLHEAAEAKAFEWDAWTQVVKALADRLV
ncbi:MAG TPA: hypothetical protein VGK67_18660 [Myxococcales bacterium]|jgi:hypothetical protein